MKKEMSLLVIGLFLTFTAQADCHEVVYRSEEYPNTPKKIDQLCIDENDLVTLLNRGRTVYSFQAVFTITPYRYHCGGREGERCGNAGPQHFLNDADNRVTFEAHVSDDSGNFGAQYLEYDHQSLKFWVKGRR